MFILNDELEDCEYDSSDTRDKSPAPESFVSFCQKFKVLFQVPYKTNFGESIAVVGSIEELGRWTKIRVNLEWTEGHIWKLIQPLEVNQSTFTYKYALISDNKIVKLESGIERIADCCLENEIYELSYNDVSNQQI